MKGKRLGLSVVILALSSCVVRGGHDRDDYRSRDHGRSACVDQAQEQGYRRVEVQSVESIGATVGPGTWEVKMRAMASTGREVKLSCEYDEERRRVAVNRVD